MAKKAAVQKKRDRLKGYPIIHYLDYALLVADMDQLPIGRINAPLKSPS